jgi:hypothetical protein
MATSWTPIKNLNDRLQKDSREVTTSGAGWVASRERTDALCPFHHALPYAPLLFTPELHPMSSVIHSNNLANPRDPQLIASQSKIQEAQEFTLGI